MSSSGSVPEVSPLPEAARLAALIGGFRISQALYVVTVLGVPDLLAAGPATAEGLAVQAGAHAPSLRRVLRTLAGVAVFSEPDPGRFALSPLSQLLTSGHPGSLRDVAIMFMEAIYGPFGDLLHTVRTGQPAAEHFFGEPFFSRLARSPEQASRFSAAMASLSGAFKQEAVSALPLDDVRTIVDVGGADGTILAAVLQARAHLRGVLFDLPHVIAGAEPVLARHGVADRVECVGGDFFDAVPPGYDAYLLSLVLHDWSDEQAARILASVHAASGPGARLLLIEFALPPGRIPLLSLLSDLNMLALGAGRERTFPEWQSLLAAAGFTDIGTLDTGTHFWIVQATAR